jgi:hypothetical protein
MLFSARSVRSKPLCLHYAYVSVALKHMCTMSQERSITLLRGIKILGGVVHLFVPMPSD